MPTRQSLFVETFGDAPLIRVIEFFLTYPDFDYTKSYVAKEVGISRITVEKIWRQLIKNGIITKTRALRNADMYKLNVGNHRVKVLMRTAVDLSFSYLERSKPLKQLDRRVAVEA